MLGRLMIFWQVIFLSWRFSQSMPGSSTNFKISPKPCTGNSFDGTCMFVWECIKSEGRHVGMCVDSFMFGSCCAHNLNENIVMPQTVIYKPSKPFHTNKYKPSVTLTSHTSSSGTTTIHRPHGAGMIVIRPSVTQRPSLHMQHQYQHQHHQQQQQQQQQQQHHHQQLPYSSTATIPATGGSSINININNNNNNNKIPSFSISDNNNSILDLDASASIATGLWSTQQQQEQQQQSQTSQWHVTTQPNFITKPKPTSAVQHHTDKITLSWIENKHKSTKKPIIYNAYQSDYSIYSFNRSSTTIKPKPQSVITTTSKSNTIKQSTTTSPRPSQSPSRPPPTQFSSTTFSSSSSQSSPAPSSSFSTNKPTKTTTQFTKFNSTLSPFSTTPSKPSSSSTTSTSSTTTSTTTSSTSTSSVIPSAVLTKPTTTTTTTTTTKKSTIAPSTTSSLIESNDIPEISKRDTLSAAKNFDCGVSTMSGRPETRIVGGKNAPFGQWPWQVSVRRTSFFGFSSTHRCGGAIINDKWIATAGHCVDDLLNSQIRIRVGEYDFSHIQEQLPYIERAVEKKIVHPKYNFFTYEFDLALVKLDTILQFAPHISPICLPAHDDLLIGENATVTGWGRLSEGGTLPSVLQEVLVPIVSNDRCKSMFLQAGRNEFIPEIFLCAGHETGGQDSCQGDSGGPLQVKGKDGHYFLAGIISWGIGCAEANLPGVCTRISKFTSWILENVT